MNGEQYDRPRKQDYETPPEIFRELDEIFHFDIDVAASQQNKKCTWYLSECPPGRQMNDGLTESWGMFWMLGRFDYSAWCNPPYGGGQITKWLKKGKEELFLTVKTVVYLLPASTDAAWFWDCWQKHHVYLRPGRIAFLLDGKPMKSPPGGSCLVVMGEDPLVDCWQNTSWIRIDRNA